MKTFSDKSKLNSPRSIYCVGKNYPDHAREMASWEPEKPAPLPEEEPIIFMKPGTALSMDSNTSIPQFEGRAVSASLHYEGELVLLVGANVDCVELADAPACIAGYAAGLDMTLRDVQLEAKKAGNPWLKCKGFRRSALVSEFIAPDSTGAWEELAISLRLNGEPKQYSKVSKMSFSPAFLVHYLSYIYGLRAGDMIFTGTPAGVGSVRPGDQLDVSLETEGGESQPLTLVSLQATVS